MRHHQGTKDTKGNTKGENRPHELQNESTDAVFQKLHMEIDQ